MKDTLAAIAAGRVEPLYLVTGDRVLAEPAAARLAGALSNAVGSPPTWVRRPDELADVVADLRTFSLFATGKLVVVVESGALADKSAAAVLFDDVRAQLPWSGGADELVGKAREAAIRLLQILRLFDIDAEPGRAAQAIQKLPVTVFAGKSGRAGKAKGAAEETQAALVPLLEAALAAGLHGYGEGAASLLADLLRDGLPPGHVLVLVESAVAGAHPLAKSLADRGAVVEAGELTLERGKFSGLDELAAELRRETGVAIERDALEALARRTLRAEESFGQFGPKEVDARSTSRFAAEYRKLAGLLGGTGKIGRELVGENVEDRGEEDAFALTDAIGAGQAAEALSRLARRIAGAEDPVLERLAIFGRLASLCRQIVAVRGIATAKRLPLGETNYKKFENGLFRELTGEVAGIGANPLKSARSAYPVFKAYRAAARLPGAAIDRLPAIVLETERRLKGESGEPDAALAELVLAVARPA